MTRKEKIPIDCLDSYTVVEPDKVVEAIKSLVAPIIMPCQIAYDFNDLRQTLANSSQFFIASAEDHGENRIQKVLNKLNSFIDFQKRDELADGQLITKSPRSEVGGQIIGVQAEGVLFRDNNYLMLRDMELKEVGKRELTKEEIQELDKSM